jgi:hypothetical protein
MKTAVATGFLVALAAVCGCEFLSHTSPQGGSLFSDEGFKIAVPLTQDLKVLKQGEMQTVTVSLIRGKNFKQDVPLRIHAAKGITVAPADVTIKASDPAAVQLRIGAARDTAIGEYRVYVTGTPKFGEPASMDFPVKVVAP